MRQRLKNRQNVDSALCFYFKSKYIKLYIRNIRIFLFCYSDYIWPGPFSRYFTIGPSSHLNFKNLSVDSLLFII